MRLVALLIGAIVVSSACQDESSAARMCYASNGLASAVVLLRAATGDQDPDHQRWYRDLAGRYLSEADDYLSGIHDEEWVSGSLVAETRTAIDDGRAAIALEPRPGNADQVEEHMDSMDGAMASVAKVISAACNEPAPIEPPW
jgi:hypothetical protein